MTRTTTTGGTSSTRAISAVPVSDDWNELQVWPYFMC